MDDQEILACLCGNDRRNRDHVLRRLRCEVQQTPGKLPFHDARQIFRGLSSALDDTSWEVPYQCLKFISEIVSLLGDDTDVVNLVLPKALTFLASEVIALCDCSFELLNAYASQLNYSESFWVSIVKFGLRDADASTRRVLIPKMVSLLNRMRISSKCIVGLRPLVTSLVELAVNEELLDLHDVTMNALAKCLQIVGATSFLDCLNMLPKKLQIDFQNIVVDKFRLGTVFKSESCDVIPDDSNRLVLSVIGRRQSGKPNKLRPKPRTAVPEDNHLDDDAQKSKSLSRDENIEEYVFGFVPEKLWMQLSESSDWRTQDDAICELKQRLLSLNKIDSLLPELENFLHGLRRYFDDSRNFSPWVIITGLEILEILIRKLGFDLQKFLKTIAAAILKQLSRHPMKVQRLIDQMIRKISPMSVLEVFCDNLCQVHDSEVQRETLDAIVITLLSHPNETFNFETIVRRVVPMLISSRREVRQAALECIAVLFRILGPSQVKKLLVEIDLLDKRVRARGMKAAVLARLARSQSLVIQSSGKLVYVTRVPSDGSEWSNSSSGQSGADIHWIMFGPGMKTSESNPLSVVRSESKCCCVSSTYAPPEICSDELSKRVSALLNIANVPFAVHSNHLVSLVLSLSILFGVLCALNNQLTYHPIQ